MLHENMCSDATAWIKGGEATPHINGKAWFYQMKNGVLMEIMVSGLPDDGKSDFFALHIHEGGNCAGLNFSETGMHFNPETMRHPKHAGDLPPLLSSDGEAYMKVLTHRFSLCDVIGKTLVIHDGRDDFITQPSGKAGMKIACGVIVEGTKSLY